MKVIITVDFQNEASKADFLNCVTQALGEICGGSSINATDMGELSVIHCCQPTEYASHPNEISTDVPPVELSSDTFDADLLAQQAAMAQAELSADIPVSNVEPVSIEFPTVNIPSAEVTIDDPTVELDKELETTSLPSEVEMGPCVILSLTSANNIPAVVYPNSDKSCLVVQTDAVGSDGILNFWFGKIEFRVPPAVDAAGVLNPDHEIGPSTIRIVARKLDSYDTFALLVDVVSGDMEMLSICGQDASLISG